MNFINLEHEIDEMIMSGLYKTVDIEFLKSINNIKLSSETSDYIEDTLQAYKNYLNLLNGLPRRYRKAFLKALKEEELRNNQQNENENLFLLEMFQYLDDSNSIDYGVSILNSDNKFTNEDIRSLHNKIMEGTSSNINDNYNFRTNTKTFVGTYSKGELSVDYFPMKTEDLPKAINFITDFLNKDTADEHDILVKPIIAHLLISAVQAFDDGNTRLARLVSHLKMWDLSRRLGLNYTNLPAVYTSKSFILTRPNYREKIKKVIVNNDDGSWNDWFKYNLNAVNEQMYYNTNNIESFKSRL